MKTPALDLLFELYQFLCPFLPFAVMSFLLLHKSRKQKGGDGCLEEPSRRAEHLNFVGILLFGVYITMVLEAVRCMIFCAPKGLTQPRSI